MRSGTHPDGRHEASRRETRYFCESCWLRLLWLLLVGFLPALGCSQNSLESTVSGVVTLDGTPIGPGIIQFMPVGRAHNPATGTIQVTGDYELTTSNTLGLQAGEYNVTVAVYDQPEVAPGERAAPGSAPLRTPEKYLSADTTDLQVTVIQGANELDIKLKSK